MSARFLRAFLSVILMLLLLFGAQALSESIQPVPAGRIQSVQLPEGVETIGTPSFSDGKITIRVNDKATNWSNVILQSGSRDMLTVSYVVSAPSEDYIEGTRGDFGADDSETTDALESGAVPGWFEGERLYPLDGGIQDGMAVFAEVRFGQSPQTVYVEPVDPSGAGTLFCWEDKNHQKQYEYVQLEIIHSDSSVKTASLPIVTEKMLLSAGSSLPSGISAEAEDGGLTLLIPEEAFSSLSELPITVKAPEGASYAYVYAPKGRQRVDTDASGFIQFDIEKTSHDMFQNGIIPGQLDYSIEFHSSSSSAPDLRFLTVWLMPADGKSYPERNPGEALAADAARLTIRHGENVLSTSSLYTQSKGTVHLSADTLDVVSHPGSSLCLELAPPAGAVACGVGETGHDFIYITDWGLSDLIDAAHENAQLLGSASSVTLYDQPLTKTVTLQNGRLQVALQEGIHAKHGGYIRVICWYNSEEDMKKQSPSLIEYLVVTHDEFSREVRVPFQESESGLTDPVTEVTGISRHPWHLVVRHDPQRGDRAVHYDLRVEDASGSPCFLQEDTVFYLPYPEGTGYENPDVHFQLYHYDDSYKTFVQVDVQKTPFGLRFVENHLSPFAILWDDGESSGTESPESPSPSPVGPDGGIAAALPEPQIPQTGDARPVGMTALLLALSVSLALCLRRRKTQ